MGCFAVALLCPSALQIRVCLQKPLHLCHHLGSPIPYLGVIRCKIWLPGRGALFPALLSSVPLEVMSAMFWVCFDLWLGFFSCLSHFKYANGFSPSPFPIGRQSGCKVGEEPLSLASDSDLKSLHTYVGYLVLMPPYTIP